MASPTSPASWLAEHRATLERVLGDAVSTTISAQPVDPLPLIASLLDAAAEGDASSASLPSLRDEAAVESQVLVMTDPGQDLDDEMFLVLAAALASRGLLRLLGVITCLKPAGLRARLARGTLDQLGLSSVPVAAGTDGGSTGDADSIANMTMVDYLTHMPPAEEAGHELMIGVLRSAASASVSLVVIASLKDLAGLLRTDEALVVDRVKEIIIMGGVEPFAPGEAPPGELLVPDTAHNNEFDRDASLFVYQRCQQLRIPLRIVTRFAAYACQLPRSIYDEMAQTGSCIGAHLCWSQRQSIEKLWQRACAPEGSVTRLGLPTRCDRQWFRDTFCGGGGGELTADDGIWDEVIAFNMYDPLTLMLAIPSLGQFFVPAEFVVDGVAHKVIGSSKEATGIAEPEQLRQWLRCALLDGIRLNIGRSKRNRLVEQQAAQLAALHREVARLQQLLTNQTKESAAA